MRNRFLGLIILMVFLIPHSNATAGVFNPNFIISDFDLTDYQSMGLAGIQNLLESFGSGLAGHISEDVDGGKRTAAEMIFLAAHRHQINPRAILVMLQKEQSLITTGKPNDYQLDWAAGYGRCDNFLSCGPDSEYPQKFKGLAKQIDYLAGSLRFFLDNPDKAKLKINQSAYLDGVLISPLNQATVNLYTYTPHLRGNRTFWNIWQKWFGQFYPDGSLLFDPILKQTWLVQDGKRRKISKSALLSRFNPKLAVTVDRNTLSQYPMGKDIRFSQYSILKDENSNLYLLTEKEELREISSYKIFQNIGFSLDEIVSVKANDLSEYQKGPEINFKTIYPSGALLQDKQSGGIYYVEEGIKKPIYSKAILKTNFPNRKVVVVGRDRLNQFATGTPVKFKDGELISLSETGTTYVISKGQRRSIADGELFDELGYKKENIIYVDQKSLEIHSLGEPL